MVIEIDKARAIELLEQVVEIRGADFKYEPNKFGNCVYADIYSETISPSCGVGYALNLAGVPIETLVKLDQLNTNTDVGTLNTPVKYYDEDENETIEPAPFERIAEVILDKDAEELFAKFQWEQDHFAPYGEALNKAKGV